MSLAENLLNSLETTNVTNSYSASNEEPHIVVGADRNIIVPQSLRKIAVTGDTGVETVTFDCVRYWDGNDLSTFAIYLNYVLPNRSTGTYIPKSITANDGEDVFHFDWEINRYMTKANGTIAFSITAIKTKLNESGETVVDKQWGSFPNTECSIVEGVDIANVPSEEESPDFIAQLSAILEEIQANLENIVGNTTHGIPEYWQTHLDNRVEDIRRNMELAGRNKSSFFFYSDSHWDNDSTYTSKLAPNLLKYLYNKTPINKTNYGGDIVHGDGSTDTDNMKYLWEWREKLRGLPNHHSVIGNHDDGNGEMDRELSKEYVYSYLIAPEESNDIVWGDYFYYYIDDKSESTRYLYLDIFYDGVSSTQVNFVKQALLSTPEDWHIIAICHAWFANDYSVYPPVLNGFATEMQSILGMFDNYNARSGDYKDCGGKVELCIGGHYHLDHYDFTDGGIPVIIVEADTLHNRSGVQPQKYTTDESAISAVVVNYTTQEVDIIRIGRGNSFTLYMQDGSATTYYNVTFNLTNVESTNMSNKIAKDEMYVTTLTPTVGEMKSVVVTMGGTDITSTAYNADTGVISISAVTGAIVITAVAMADAPTGDYTNVLLTALSADGKSVYNGKGWKENTRWSESGQVEDNSDGSYLTGYIPVSKGDVIYCSGINLKNDTNSGKVLYVNTLGTSSGSHNGSQLNTDASATWHDDGTIKSFVITGDRPYIRIACNGITDSSIITKNEPIDSPDDEPEEPDAPSYTNVIKTSIDKDGNIFNSGKGWADNSRIGSGGIYLGNGTAFVTGHIKIDRTIDNTFYLKNVTFDSTTAANYTYMIAVFDASRARTTFASGGNAMYPDSDIKNYCEAVIEGNNIVQFTIGASKFASNNEYIAICCSYLGDDSIITINEPIE